MQTQDEVLGYDADHDDPSQYCRHGMWIGSWWGPDYMCGACELGLSDRDYVIGEQRNNRFRQLEAIRRVFPFDEASLARLAELMPYSAQFADFLVRQFDRYEAEIVDHWTRVEEITAWLEANEPVLDEEHFTKILQEWTTVRSASV